MQKPLVSIIIPTFNRAHLIGETLRSIQRQSFTNWECIIVNDRSVDNTAEVIDLICLEDSRFTYYERPENLPGGGNAARNFGFKMAKGEFVQWYDDDDIMLEHFLLDKLKAFDQATKFVICGGTRVNNQLDRIDELQLKLEKSLFHDYIKWNFQIVTQSVLFRRSFINTEKPFDEKIIRGQESDFFSKLFFSATEKDYKIINQPLFLYRQHSDTKTDQAKVYRSEFNYSQSKIALDNLERALLLSDTELTNFCFVAAKKYWVRAVLNKDSKIAKYIAKQLSDILRKESIFLWMHFILTTTLIRKIHPKSDTLKKIFLKSKFA